MATSSAKAHNQSLTRPKPLAGRKERRTNPDHGPDQSGSSADEKDSHKAEKKPIPNYLKPTISSRPLDTNRHPVKKFSNNNVHEDHNQKLLRRRSFDRPHSSLTSGSSTHHVHRSLNLSPRRSRDRPSIPRKETATTHHLSSSSSGKPAVSSRASNSTKKSGLGNAGSSKKEAAAAAAAGKAIKKDEEEADVVEPEDGVQRNQEADVVASAVYEAVPEIVKEATTEIQACDDDAAHSEDKEVQVETAQSEAEEEVNKDTDQETNICPDSDIPVVAKTEEVIREEPEPVTEEKLGSPVEETKEEDVKSEEEEEEGSISTGADVDGFGERSEAAEEGGEGEAGDVEEGSTEAENTLNSGERTEASKREVVEGKKVPEAPYNNVIEETRLKLIEERKNKVKALVGAFETVIDHESASSK